MLVGLPVVVVLICRYRDLRSRMFRFFVLGALTYLVIAPVFIKRDSCWCHGSSSWSLLEWREKNSLAGTPAFDASGYGQFRQYCSSVSWIRYVF